MHAVGLASKRALGDQQGVARSLGRGSAGWGCVRFGSRPLSQGWTVDDFDALDHRIQRCLLWAKTNAPLNGSESATLVRMTAVQLTRAHRMIAPCLGPLSDREAWDEIDNRLRLDS